jgi:crossover junction endodeoxyribonuclease RuvC
MTLPLDLPRTPRVIGVDLSMSATGLATAAGATLVKTKPQCWSSDLARLRHIAARVRDACVEAAAELVVLEGLSYGSNYGKVSERAGLHWLVRHYVDNAGFPIAIVTPSARCKYICGKGNAPKDAVMIACVQRLPIVVSDNNEADAVILYAMGMDHLGAPIATMPAAHRAALGGAQWPSVERAEVAS